MDEKTRLDLLSKSELEFEEAVGFTEEEWISIKEGLRRREINAKARLNVQAPYFEAALIKDGSLSNETVRLTDFTGNPLALVLGSYTCPIFRSHNPLINEIYEMYKDRINFLQIYTYEMHPLDGWIIQSNLKDRVIYNQPKTLSERVKIAQDWIIEKSITMPVAIDSMANVIDELYAGSPERLYLIDSKGIIRFKSDEGPFDDSNLDRWEVAIADVL